MRSRKYSVALAAIVSLCGATPSFESDLAIFESLFTSKKEMHEEVLRNREDPNRMIKKIEDDRRADASKEFKRQNQKEDVARANKINEQLEKQFLNQRSPNP